MGRHGLGKRNENGDIFIELCANYDLIIGGSLFPHKDIHKATWMAPNHSTFNKIDHMAISKKWKRSLLDVRGLVLAQIKLKLAANKTPSKRVTRKKFNI